MIWIYPLVVLALVLILINSCKKEEPTAIPIISTSNITDITATTATSGGNISSDGRATIIARGVCWSTTENPFTSDQKTNDGTGSGQFASNLIGLSPGTVYHIRAYATNSVGTAYGRDLIFTTIGEAPTASTQAASNIQGDLATLNGIVNANWVPTSVLFEYGTTTNYGYTATATQSPVTGSTDINVSAEITGLTSCTTYHFRVKAVSALGTTFGDDLSLTTLLTDTDGNVYTYITIGTQVWIAENLKTTKYNDGAAIPNVTDATEWAALTTPSYCWYWNDATTFKATYGALYNWYAVNTGKLCPAGWHVPTDAEWTTLTTFLGGENVAGGKLKETGTTHWASPNTGATNETGFTALPGGIRLINGKYYGDGYYIYWWSSTEYTTSHVWDRCLYFDSANMTSYFDSKQAGFSVRCLKD